MLTFAELHEPRHALLDSLLRLRLRESSYCQSLLAAPWGLAVPESARGAAYVFVARGRATLRAAGERVALGPGDFALLAQGDAHELASGKRTPVYPLSELEWDSVLGRCIVRSGGAGAVTHLLTGGLDFELNALLPALPPVLSLSAEQAPDWLAGLSALLVDEAAQPGAGSELVLSRLAELLAVGAIREWLDGGDEESPGLLRALRDPPIRRSLDLLHRDPREPWTVASLAKAVGLSRSAFAARFQACLGVSPMRYYTRWRMGHAEQWLRDEQRSVEEVADALGYASRAAFTRAFKSALGHSPGQARRRARERLTTINERLV
ncbi:transcriptional regulator, AraC family protein [Plesiocystis pacifica SIR-1]|uniref:Transcriptional regulator, AraC family protein n=1 Tax=Plesiocystis pacifica SIR-1 TaxID=391625 RepID=A6G0H9_9BACT|nr:AraC family transcriptional regulator [Plesiocystis pacifica]EDM80625.1 transcriptional regulator, AraC family protein [Plesiocystis pacifica SIR-1]